MAAIEHQKKVYAKYLTGRKNGKYKIEVFFGKKRSTWKPFSGVITMFESGNKMHGGGDTLVHICPNKECDAIMLDAANIRGLYHCIKCNMRWPMESVYDTIGANLSAQNWAVLILKWYAKLQHDADIYLKYAPDDIRSLAKLEQERQRHGELLAKAEANTLRATGMYPLERIIADTSGGADLLTKFKAFLLA